MVNQSEFIGKKFNYLTVLEITDKKDSQGLILAKCQCNCGKIIYKPLARIKSSRIKSCGCLRAKKCREKNIANGRSLVIGEKFGNLTVVEDLGYNYRSNSRGDHIRWCRCRCDCGNYLEVSCNNLFTGSTQSCGCVKSKGERIIAEILRENNIPFKQQVSFKDLKTEKGDSLKFDFGIYDKNGNLIKLIEFDGRQHFVGPDATWTQSDSLETIQERDRQKDEYCLKKNISLLRIPYFEINRLSIDYLI